MTVHIPKRFPAFLLAISSFDTVAWQRLIGCDRGERGDFGAGLMKPAAIGIQWAVVEIEPQSVGIQFLWPDGREHGLNVVKIKARSGEGDRIAQMIPDRPVWRAVVLEWHEIERACGGHIVDRELAKSNGDTQTDAWSLVLLGSLALAEGFNAEGVELLASAYRIALQSGLLAVQSEALVWLGDAARMRSDFVTARRMYEDGLAVARKTNVIWYEANALGMMAELALAEGNIAEAKLFAADALTGYLAAGDCTYCVLLLDTLAGIALAEGNAKSACTLVAAVDRLSEEIKMQMPGHEQKGHDARVAAARALLPPEWFESLYRGSDTLTWEQIIEFARHAD